VASVSFLKKLNFQYNVLGLIAFLSLSISGFGLQIIFNHFYSVDGLGLFNSTLSYFLIFSLVATLGLNYGIQAIIPKLDHKKDNIESKRLIQTAFIGSFLGSLVLILIFGITSFFNSHIGNLKSSTLAGLSISFIFFSINKITSAYFIARKNERTFYGLQILRYTLLLVLSLLFSVFKFDTDIIWIIFVFNEFIVSIVCFYLIHTELNVFHLKNVKAVKLGKNNLFIHSVKAMPGGFLQELITRIDIIMISMLSSLSSIGIYSVASMIAEGLNQLLVVDRERYSAQMTEVYQSKNADTIGRFLKPLVKRGFIIILLLGLCAVLFYQPIVTLLFDETLAVKSFNIFLILILGLIFSSPYTMLLNFPNQIGKPEVGTFIVFGVIVSNITLNFFLIKHYDVVGSAFATSISWIFGSFLFLVWIGVFLKRLSFSKPLID
jgi:O-antigen/teichoic acid export membrane protein